MTRKKVSIIYTGGTLGMRPSESGYAPARDLGRLLHERLPELRAETMPDYELLEYDEPLESANATPRHWYELAQKISSTGDDFDGFVVIHGTDTLAYTASALSFLLGDFGKPVVVTGSQIPLCEVRNDAQGNLIGALQAISTGRMTEVGVCFGRHIYRGNRTTKVNATELDAFASPNFPPLAEIGTDFYFNECVLPRPGNGVFGARPPAYRECNIAALRVFPGMPASLIDAIAGTGAAGIVLSCYGVGTAPTADKPFLEALKRACAAGVLVIAVSQCAEGSVSLRRYASGSLLADLGVMSGYDMTVEAAFTKMHALFALGLERAEIARHMQSNLRGELTVS